MKVYRKIILDKNDKVLFEDSYDYKGKWTRLGIHYDYKSTRSAKKMQKDAKREKKLAERKARKAKRQAKAGADIRKEKTEKALDPNQALSLDFLTNPDKK